MNIKISAVCLFLTLLSLTTNLSCRGIKISLSKTTRRITNLPYQTHLSNAYDIDFYTGDVSIGSPPQFFRLIFDTTTSDTFVQSSNCTGKGCKGGYQYQHGNSFTYNPVGTKVNLKTGGWNLEGEISQDTFRLSMMILRNTRFAEMNRGFDNAFNHARFDGVLGMNFERNALGEEVSPLAHAYEMGFLSKKSFSFWLSDEENDAEAGLFFLGESNSDYYDGNLTYVDVSKKGFWQIKIDEINVAKNTGVKLCTKGCQASVDTGVKNLFGPKEEVDQLRKLLGATKKRNGWHVPCNKVDSFPALLFTMNSKKMPLPAKHYTYTHDNNKICFLGLGYIDDVRSRANGADWVLGNLFNRMWYTEFDSDNKRIGFAPGRENLKIK